MYLICEIKPDIAFAIKQLNKHNTNPKKYYLQVTKKVIRYLKRII